MIWKISKCTFLRVRYLCSSSARSWIILENNVWVAIINIGLLSPVQWDYFLVYLHLNSIYYLKYIIIIFLFIYLPYLYILSFIYNYYYFLLYSIRIHLLFIIRKGNTRQTSELDANLPLHFKFELNIENVIFVSKAIFDVILKPHHTNQVYNFFLEFHLRTKSALKLKMEASGDA